MIERIKQVVAQMMSHFGTQQLGTVYDYDQDTYSVRVNVQPSGEITGWLPIGVEWVGNGYGMAIGPNIGDMVRIDPVEGSKQVAIMGKRFYNDIDLPMKVPSGECWMVHSSGSLLKFLNDGSVTVHAAIINSSSTQWNHTGNMTLTGDVLVTGNISDMNGTKGTLQHIRDNYDVHTHTDPQGGTTGTPSNTL